MKNQLLILVAVLLPVLAFAQDAKPRADIDELFTAMRMDKMMSGMSAQMKPMIESIAKQAGLTPAQQQSSQAMEEKMLDLVQAEMGGAKMKAALAKVYAETFTVEEIKGISAFYKSAAGQAFLDKTPALMQKSMVVSQSMMAEVMPKIQALAAEEAAKAAKH